MRAEFLIGHNTEGYRITATVRLDQQPGRRETIEHGFVDDPMRVSVTSWASKSRTDEYGGATMDPLREVIESGRFAQGWDAESIGKLAEMGERWHLNDMQAACAHQTVVYEKRYGGMQPSLGLTGACDVTGYRYGSAWLVELLPPEAELYFRELIAAHAPA